MIYLNPEQDKLVRLDPRGHRLIRGVAGSGKTTIALYRAKYLSENYLDMFIANKILVLTYNSTLVAFMREQARELGLEGVEISTFHRWAYRYLTQKEVPIGNTVQGKEKGAIFKKACDEVRRRFPNHPLLNRNPFFFRKEIQWMKGSCILDLETYLSAERQGKGGRLNAEDRKIVFAVFKQYQHEMQQKRRSDYEDFALLALDSLEDDDSFERYTHIVVDEAQDLSKAELTVITKLVNPQTNSINLLVDVAQKIYDTSFTWEGVGIDIQEEREHILNKNFRTTVEIAEAAYSLLEKDTDFVQNSEDYVKPEQINKDLRGCYPIYRRFGSLEEGTDYVVEEIKRLKEQTTCGLSEMVILHPNSKSLRFIQKRLNDVHQIPNHSLTAQRSSHEAEEVKLCTMHSIKGLEARVVFILGVDEGNLPFVAPNVIPPGDIAEKVTQERKLLYVGMTRAKEWLYLISGRNPSRYLSEIDRRFLRLSASYRLRPFYAIPPEEYLFQQLVNNDSPEEWVRQWLLRELIESYGFPKKLFDGRTVDIEVPIAIGGSQYFADVAIQKEFQGEPKPLVLFEVKRLDSTEGIDQLHGYLSACPTARIGVWTNGCELKCFIKNDNQIEPRPDIPVYNEATFG